MVFVLWRLSAFAWLKELVWGRKEPILGNRRVLSGGKEARLFAGVVQGRSRLDAEEERTLADGRPSQRRWS